MKRRRAGSDRGQIDLQEPEGLGVDDVEAAASVHEDLGKPDVADDGIDNERVLSRARHAVGVVTLVEGYFFPSALATDRAMEVFPVPGGPTRQIMGLVPFFVRIRTARYLSLIHISISSSCRAATPTIVNAWPLIFSVSP